MRRTSVHLGCIIPVVLLVGSSVATEFPSDAQVRDIISSAPGTEEFPEASLLYLKLLERVTLSTDGQTVKEGLALIKILQDRARDRENVWCWLPRGLTCPTGPFVSRSRTESWK
jgi:hypothetical protein